MSLLSSQAISTLAQLEDRLVTLGAKPIHLRKLYRAWLGLAPWPDASDEGLPKALRAQLPELKKALQAVAAIRSRHAATDGESERLLVNLRDGQTIESVLLPRDGVCVSTQLGCAVGCLFCMTGQGGLIRQLSDIEIVAQVVLARSLRSKTKKVVFMGMGEPSHNLENVFRALTFLADYGDFGHKNLVVSTVGDERLFERLHSSRVKPALAVSLHTVDDKKRRQLLPRGTRMSVDALIEAAQRWASVSHYPTQYQWTLIDGVNNSLDEIQTLAERLQGHYAMVNFIPVNAVDGSSFKRPAAEANAALVRACRARGVIATLRDSAAQDVDGGCGQLRARVILRDRRHDARVQHPNQEVS